MAWSITQLSVSLHSVWGEAQAEIFGVASSHLGSLLATISSFKPADNIEREKGGRIFRRNIEMRDPEWNVRYSERRAIPEPRVLPIQLTVFTGIMPSQTS